MTSSYELHVDRVNVNHDAKYLSPHLSVRTLLFEHTQTHTHNIPTTLPPQMVRIN